MGKILVSGLINFETTLQVEGFPIYYNPVRYPFFGINGTISGVGYNLAKALTTLGTPVNFLSLIGTDPMSALITEALTQDGINQRYVLKTLNQTPYSVILYDHNGKRQINVDLKDVQQRVYPPELFRKAIEECDLAALCNINFSRPFLRAAKHAGKLIATDVHTIHDLEHDYDRDFMQYADILFMSDETLPEPPESWIRKVRNRYGNEIIVIGLGEKGAILSVKSDNSIEYIPALQLRDVANTIGAGDALFSAFIHCYHQSKDPYTAIRKAVVFASYKIGDPGAADGFLNQSALDSLYEQNKSYFNGHNT